ncbi:L-alanine-DL-glutamate epimerase [Cohaesibacter sp. ES.047]|uniref:mandelate racemase/muconate lactonizing enzyme family protein n=1 Tax=Cohaesibacter sp. ES.047 TaxID=1798205 RepID=UPI000BC07649|nr:mandelate racemase/muconate lactonizing enzyme family protein [Cohaesibacter sp. ES.047]SNY90262.1 L-alanine-DL-glutamate epimerase [Cohaesibacter sp. ES.047]
MRIEEVSVSAHRIAPVSPWEDATNKVQALEFVFVVLKTDTGLEGTGFSYSVDVGITSISALIEDYLAPLIVGMDPLDREQIWTKLQRQSRRLGTGVNMLAIAAIDVAVWDLIGKALGQPLWRLFGGARPEIPAYISEIKLTHDDTLADFSLRLDDYKAQGYRAVKFKIGRTEIEEDIARIRLAREKIGPDGKIFVDLNQKWTSSEARQKAAQLASFQLGWIEEPLLFHDVAAHATLRKSTTTPIALGESLFSRAQFLEYLQQDAVDIIQADVAFVGGPSEWLKIAHLADIFGRPVAPHYMMELSLHLLCGVPNGFMLENVIGGSFTELGLLEDPIVVKDAIGRPPSDAGHGLKFDRAALDACAIRPDGSPIAFAGGSK